MCGRYMFLAGPEELVDEFGLSVRPEGIEPAYNVAPSHLVAVVGSKPNGTGRGLVRMRWGFVPRWAKSPNDGPRPVNATAETAAANPAFRDSFRGRRCLIPASGFYEWQTTAAGKVPHVFRPATGVMAFAGLWDVWAPKSADPLFTCVILTVPANRVTAFCHQRMPAILPREHYAAWLDAATPPGEVAALLTPAPDDLLTATALAPTVGNVRNTGPDCLTPAA
jgi:putative SOS response-associated peptidase YedK